MNFRQKHETLNDAEAHTLASEWVQRLERSLLAGLSDETFSQDGRSVPLPERSLRSEGLEQITSSTPLVDPKYANWDRNPACPSADEQHLSIDQDGRTTARVDLNLIRQKRLEYFELGSPAQPHKGITKETNIPEQGLRPFENFGHRSDTSAGVDECSPRSYGEDEEIRLDLWGLKDAVKSGEVDLKAYIRDAPRPKRRGIGKSEPDSNQTSDNGVASNSLTFKENSGLVGLPLSPRLTDVRESNWGSTEQRTTKLVDRSADMPLGRLETDCRFYKGRRNKCTPDKKGKEAILGELTEFMRTSNQLDTSGMYAAPPCAMISEQKRTVNHQWVSHDTEGLERSCKGSAPDMLRKPSANDFHLKGENSRDLKTHSNDTGASAGDVGQMAKICPSCGEMNSKAANWCIECGSAFVTVKPSFLSVEQTKEYEQQCEQTKSLMLDLWRPADKATGRNGLVNQISGHSNDCSSKTVDKLTDRLDGSLAFTDGRQSQANPDYKRRWLRSSTAWSTYDCAELSKPSSIPTKQMRKSVKKQCPPDAFNMSNTSTHKEVSRNDKGDLGLSSRQTECNHASPVLKPIRLDDNSICRSFQEQPDHLPFTGQASCPTQVTFSSKVPALNLEDVGSYERILTLIRSQRDSEPLPYLCLPDEILLHIFSFLPQGTLATCSLVCQQFHRVAMDNALWQSITLEKKSFLTNHTLAAVGKRRPASLTISYCRGDAVSSQGLRVLFRQCGDTLEELDFSGCSGGELIGESLLLHVAARCSRLRLVDASWSNVSDNGVRALADSVERLECLCLNGCQAVTNACLESVTSKHGHSLRIFEVFGCFNITPAGISFVAQRCPHLQTLNIGQCHKITDAAIGSVVSGLHELENVDLRGCKQIRDTAVKKIVRHCSLLTSLVLANCPMITDSALEEIAACLPAIRSLDICGCAKVTDAGVRALSRSCHRLENFDLSSTGVTHKSVTTLANYCSQSLCTLKLSFCADVSDNTVKMLVKYCKRLTTLHLYGCKLVRNLDALKLLNANLTIEC